MSAFLVNKCIDADDSTGLITLVQDGKLNINLTNEVF